MPILFGGVFPPNNSSGFHTSLTCVNYIIAPVFGAIIVI